MKELLLEWQDLWIPEYIPRDYDLSVLEGDVRKAIIFTGCRRAGKTYLMFQIIDRLTNVNGVERESIVYLNFEDERIEWDTQILTNLLPTLIELYGERDYHLFLDEIHHIPNWDRWVRRIYDRYKNINIFISSSSSRLSSKEIPYSLRGRTLVIEVFPLSFSEFVRFKGKKLIDPKRMTAIKRAKTLALLNEYLYYGGFPEVVLESSPRNKRLIIQDYFRTIVALDVCERYGISNLSLIHNYVKLIVNQTYYSTNKMYNIFRSQGYKIGKVTLLNYTHYLEEVFFIFFVEIFSLKIKDRQYYPRKVYLVDNSFINHVATKFSDDIGRQLENATYLYLLKNYDKEQIFYWKDSNGHEVDFIIVEGEGVIEMLQVCADISNQETKTRELRSLLSGKKELKCEKLTIITRDVSAEEDVDGTTIRYVPIYELL